MKRRQFLPLLAAGASLASCRKTNSPRVWRGTVFNSPVSITFVEKAPATDLFFPKIQALEKVFSLYLPESSLSKLNREGRLLSPPVELVTLLRRCQSYHSASQKLFDPTIQSYWTWLANEHQTGRSPSEEERTDQLAKVDFSKVEISEQAIELNGTQLTLNAVAQGFLTDQIADHLQGLGASNALIDLGEYRALGGPFPIAIRHPQRLGDTLAEIALTDRSLAVSSGSGHRLTATGDDNHILSTETGTSPHGLLTTAVLAENATDADAWATIANLLSQRENSRIQLPSDIEIQSWQPSSD